MLPEAWRGSRARMAPLRPDAQPLRLLCCAQGLPRLWRSGQRLWLTCRIALLPIYFALLGGWAVGALSLLGLPPYMPGFRAAVQLAGVGWSMLLIAFVGGALTTSSFLAATAGFIAAGIVVALFIVDRDELPQRQRHLDSIDELSGLPAEVPQSMPHTRDMVQAWVDGFLAMRPPAIAAQQRCERTLCAISMITQLVCPQSEVDAWVAAAAQARRAAAAQEQPSTAAQLLTVAAGAGQPQGGEAPPQQAAAEQEAAG